MVETVLPNSEPKEVINSEDKENNEMVKYYLSRLQAQRAKRKWDRVYYEAGRGYYIVRANPKKKSFWDRFF